MPRIRTGARYGLRWGMFGFVAAVFTLTSQPIQAAPYADIVVDANSGTVLHSTNPDAQRHPASLTKIMTLYLLFERLEAGELKLDSQLKVSAEAAGQAPTKLGLKPGSILSFTRNAPRNLLSVVLHPHNDNFHLTHHLAPRVPPDDRSALEHLDVHARVVQLPRHDRSRPAGSDDEDGHPAPPVSGGHVGTSSRLTYTV